ncbi:MAG: 2-oxoglutarate dehydrogenase complex dihydrolipoyllysine-residue succinyltransferase [Planctomycetota bacterium]
MPTDLIVPEVGESITEVQIGRWLKQPGEAVKKDEPLVEIETDKVTLELPAPADGVIGDITHDQGADASVGDTIGTFNEGAAAAGSEAKETKSASEPAASSNGQPTDAAKAPKAQTLDGPVMPAAQLLIDQNGLDAAAIPGTGPNGRILKEDVLNFIKHPPATPKEAVESPAPAASPVPTSGARETKRVPMTPLRKSIAANLVQAQQTAALLTTFNECDMTQVMAMRAKYNAVANKKTGQGLYEVKHGTKLGFMSFFVKAACDALQAFPAINARVDGTDVIYQDFCDVGIAIGGGKGLVVPVLRNAEAMSFADVEKGILDYAIKAKNGKIQLADMTGGTFTITNGGVYGSLLSTPIVNPPQSGVLGMHGIVRRPIAVDPGTPNERIEIRPMMYLALTYDHRVVDGREAVSCLKRICDCIEDPTRMLMEA